MIALTQPRGTGRQLSRLLCAAALMLVAVVPGGSASPDGSAASGPPEYDGFRFSPGTCEQGPDFCAQAKPHDWAASEIALVRAALDEIAANGLGRWITQRARRNGFLTLRRFAHAAELD